MSSKENRREPVTERFFGLLGGGAESKIRMSGRDARAPRFGPISQLRAALSTCSTALSSGLNHTVAAGSFGLVRAKTSAAP